MTTESSHVDEEIQLVPDGSQTQRDEDTEEMKSENDLPGVQELSLPHVEIYCVIFFIGLFILNTLVAYFLF